MADEGTVKYTNKKKGRLHFSVISPYFSRLLCWPLLSPQIVGAVLVDPETWKVSVQVPVAPVGCAMENDWKSNLKLIGKR